ncbi:sodium:solute symporter family transporter [Actinomadura rupiterrae]|uniref:sodium:solute symporter family transporter n=1 Tax=Actinomadura rupiterrae TaxID=559627 RepID=UPI0020A3A319|nr:cation acetate symporter [Actinomadura rupiterrae]MCP2338434.1 Na+(H+)/acetate symporter ActP [Actinomadura rupiterrae]
MSGAALAAALSVLTVVAATLRQGAAGRRTRLTATDLLVASRGVTPLWNASAISSEYISAAAFLGTAGLVLAYGTDTLWLPVAATGGFVLLVAFVTAPLRRSGAYTISDFAEWRLGSVAVRRTVSACVCFIGWFYLLPQFQGAGVTLRVLTGAPVWAGWIVVVGVALAITLSGGMRSITAVQAVQFWVKLLAVAVPAAALLVLWRLDGASTPAGPPVFARATTIRVQTDSAVRVSVDTVATVSGPVDDGRHDGDEVVLTAGLHRVGAGAELLFPRGAAVPHAARLARTGGAWSMPSGRGRDHSLYTTYSALLAVLLGTMGLPHILMRFYTNTCGRAARRTAAMVPVLLSLFYLFPALYGTLGRLYTPELLMTGDTDATILTLPGRLAPGLPGSLLVGLVAAGAFAAFVSTTCGVVVAIAGTVSQCFLRGGTGSFRIGALFALAVPLCAAGAAGTRGAAGLVTLALTVSACSLCPLLLLGLWWRRLTPLGAGAGLAFGGGLAVVAGGAGLFLGPRHGWTAALLAQPALILAPASLAVMVGVSLASRRSVPQRADRALARMHLPEEIVVR